MFGAPDWFWKALTVVIAGWAAWTAWQQHRVTRDKLRLDLFEKRMAVYDAVKHAIELALERNAVDLENLQIAVVPATFLFGSDVNDYIREVGSKLKDMKDYGADIRLTAAIVEPIDAPEEHAFVRWLKNQPQRAVKVFAPYLSFSESRL